MILITNNSLSKIHENVTRQALEQYITDLEIENALQEQELTDHDIAIAELQEKIENL